MFVGADVTPHQKRFASLEVHVGFLEVDSAGSNSLDLGTDQLNTGLKRLQNVVVVSGLPIGG